MFTWGKTSPSKDVLFQTLLYMYIGHGKDLPSNDVLFQTLLYYVHNIYIGHGSRSPIYLCWFAEIYVLSTHSLSPTLAVRHIYPLHGTSSLVSVCVCVCVCVCTGVYIHAHALFVKTV